MTAPAWVFQRGILWAIDFGRTQPAAVVARVPVRFVEAGRESLEALAQAMELPEPTEARRRLETGRRCLAGWLDDRIVTYGWLSLGDEEVGELERTYRIQPGDAYIWHCATLPERRGQGLYGALLSHINATLQAEGVRRAWIGANLENEPSLRAFARAGFRPVMEVAYARLFGLCALWMSAQRGAPGEFVDGARRMLVAAHERTWGALAVGLRPGPGAARRSAA
jgi:ribosomal protein S18 acetylase RimI-like enzyme